MSRSFEYTKPVSSPDFFITFITRRYKALNSPFSTSMNLSSGVAKERISSLLYDLSSHIVDVNR